MKTLLVGQAPSRTSDPSRPLAGEPLASALARLCGVSVEHYLDAFERMNLLDRWPGKAAKGDRFPLKEARVVADRVSHNLNLLGGNWKVILLGRNVAEAFGGFRVPYLTWHPDPMGLVAILPHPSGVNRWYNDPKNRRRAERFMRRALKESA